VKAKLKALLALLLLGYAALVYLSSDHYRSGLGERAFNPDLPMTFAHMDHAKEKCVDCHHNYQDDTGHGLCLDCHRRDPEVNHLMEEQFHDLCRGCHAEKQLQGDDSGPLRSCTDCHQEDFLP
jgi:hypothetical protein